MTRGWKPGEVGVSAVTGERFLVVADGYCAWESIAGSDAVSGAPVSTDRPLVVIDPEDREQVERLVRWYYERFAQIPGAAVSIEGGEVDALQAALREFANPTPPKPDEPTGLGAVVEDAAGECYVGLGNHFADGSRRWQSVRGMTFCKFSSIAAVRVLHEGVLA